MYDLSGFCKIQQKGMPQLTISLGSTKPAADLLIRASEGAQKRWGGAFLVTETELLSNLFISMIPELLQSFSEKKTKTVWATCSQDPCCAKDSFQFKKRTGNNFLNESVDGALSFYLFFQSKVPCLVGDTELLNKKKNRHFKNENTYTMCFPNWKGILWNHYCHRTFALHANA